MILTIQAPCASLLIFSGRGRQFAVHLGHGAGGRRVQIRDRLHRFHRAKRLAGGDLGADFGQFDENDVAQRLLGVVGDADGGVLAVGFDPLVLFGVFEVGWDRT